MNRLSRSPPPLYFCREKQCCHEPKVGFVKPARTWRAQRFCCRVARSAWCRGLLSNPSRRRSRRRCDRRTGRSRTSHRSAACASMSRRTAMTKLNPALHRFALRLYEDLGIARVLLFGSHARDGAAPDSDYDLILVSNHFRSVPRMKRQVGLRRLFYSVGGRAPMDLICLTPEEFEDAARRDTLIAAVLPHAIDLLPEAA